MEYLLPNPDKYHLASQLEMENIKLEELERERQARKGG
jgi:hypothetical protein